MKGFCSDCGSITLFSEICSVCSEFTMYCIGERSYTYKEVYSNIQSKIWTGFTLVSTNESMMIPLHRHKDFLVFFLQDNTKQHVEEYKKNPQAAPKRHFVSKQMYPNTPKRHLRRGRQFLVLGVMLLTTLGYYASQKSEIFRSKSEAPPSLLQQFIHKERDSTQGSIGFPKEGDVDRLAQKIQSSIEDWNGEDVGAFLLSASLEETPLDTDFFNWISWALNRYPRVESIKAANASWNLRYHNIEESCSIAKTCTHQACEAIVYACRGAEFEQTINNSYMTRYALSFHLASRQQLERAFIDTSPEPLRFALMGDYALQQGQVKESITWYTKSKLSGLDVDEELMLAHVLMGDFIAAESLFSSRFIAQVSGFTKHVMVRVYIELGKIDKAYDFVQTLPKSSEKEMQLHHLRALRNKNIESTDFDCIPKNHSERLYCARIYILLGGYSKALNTVSSLDIGDPIRSITELMIAMRKGDSIAMDDAIETFAYGQPKLLDMIHPRNAFVPRIPKKELVKTLRAYLQNQESKKIMEWALSQNPSKILDVDVVSAPVCSATLQFALEQEDYKMAQEKLRCLGFFDIDSRSLSFFHQYLKSKRNPDLYQSTWREILSDSTPRSLLYWEWKEERSLKVRNRIVGENRILQGYGQRWYQSQMQPLQK